MDLVELHKYPHLKEECCELLNKQWKRSITARMHSLDKSCDNLPISLVFIDTKDGKMEVIGHSRLNSMFCEPKGCSVESVLIKEERRGQGLGKLLMQKTEDYARKLGFDTIYLTTGDKQGFYEHLGYTYYSPGCLIGNLINQQSTNLFPKVNSNISHVNDRTVNRNNISKLGINIPVPPPLPQSSTTHLQDNIFNRQRTYCMKKFL